MILQAMRGEREEPLSPDLKDLESGVREPSYKRYAVPVDALSGGVRRSCLV
jgi:hypothetical protein